MADRVVAGESASDLLPTATTATTAALQLRGQDGPSAEGTNAEDLPWEVIEGEPFIKGDGDAHEVDPNDVDQGHLGDCWLLAGLAAIAKSNPELIKKMITPVARGRWAVTFHFPTKDGTFEPETVIVDAAVPVKKPGVPYFAGSGDKKSGKSELWVLLIEKAYAKTQGKYSNITGKHAPVEHHEMEIVTGKKNGRIDPTADSDTLLEQLELALVAHKGVTLGTVAGQHPNAPLANDFPPVHTNHTYALDSVDKGARSVDLLNPWGPLDGVSVEIERLKKLVDWIHTNG